ncbi:hypothetical protein [Cupriavidus alkaliphilus]|uniref:Uncharacterized protein n=1 Tax=Cupriavidus alkaliphilus TaxID=942866 RepID=A0A7W4VDA1_9BURK|nr:hypothetical protein [Cupriavidus alkaliphilus]MBB3009487.1 hypothetical protein [Cupriavidus alkaliphilus]
MTIAVAWVRKIRDCEELVFVSDSRLSGDGATFDGCPKILTLPRSDCAISFAGYTGHAFPMMLQLSLAIDSHAPSKRGSLDLAALRSHALKIFDSMGEQLKTSKLLSLQEDVLPGATFLFGGYSWIKKKFELWSFSYRAKEGCFVADPAQWLMFHKEADRVILRNKKIENGETSLGKIAFAGDQAPLAKELLLKKLNSFGAMDHESLDMEPFEVVRDMLRDRNHSETIGGAPQIVKVYQYMRTASLGVYWPNRTAGKVHLQGRACLGYERVDRWVLDPDELISETQPLPRESDELMAEDNDPQTRSYDKLLGALR